MGKLVAVPIAGCLAGACRQSLTVTLGSLKLEDFNDLFLSDEEGSGGACPVHGSICL